MHLWWRLKRKPPGISQAVRPVTPLPGHIPGTVSAPIKPAPKPLYVKAILTCAGRVLVLRRSATHASKAGKWDLPGGRVDSGETVVQALEREIMEETGLPVASIGKGWQTDGGWLFEVETYGGHITLSREHDLYWWVTRPAETELIKLQDKYRLPLVERLRSLCDNRYS